VEHRRLLRKTKEKAMNKLNVFLVASMLLAPAAASAQTCPSTAEYDRTGGGCVFRAFDQTRGELSPHTQAPTAASLEEMLHSSAAPSQIASMLEYGERVECTACIPLLEHRILEDSDPTVRELAAWWLRRRPLGFGAVMHDMSTVLANPSETATRRERAAAAIGEFMDPHGVDHLGQAIMTDTAANVRAAAVRGIARINASTGLRFISMALADSDPSVQLAAVTSILRVNFFSDSAAVLPLLASSDAGLRRHAASVVGSLRASEAVPVLSAMLTGDTDRGARQSAAWALGQIGGADALAALTAAASTEHESLVRDAIENALGR
jgi:HEAT repeat protein